MIRVQSTSSGATYVMILTTVTSSLSMMETTSLNRAKRWVPPVNDKVDALSFPHYVHLKNRTKSDSVVTPTNSPMSTTGNPSTLFF